MYCSETDSADRPVHTLIIGYGNPMRGNDGAGTALVEALHKRLGGTADRDLEIVSCMQLTPELTHDMSRSQRVIFADASVRIPAGKVTIRRVTANSAAQSCAHHYGPDQLLNLCRRVFNSHPETWIAEIGVESMGMGEPLSPATASAVERLAGHLSHRLSRSLPAGVTIISGHLP